MDTQIERDLKDALAARAAQLTGKPGTRILAHDYKPRSSLPARAFVGVGAVFAVGAVAATLTATLGTNTPGAFAGWSQTPSSPAGARSVAAEEACRSGLPTSAAIEHAQETAAGSRTPWPLPTVRAGDWQTVLTDVRGPYTAILFAAAEGKVVFSCFSGRDPRAASLGGGWGTHTLEPVPAGRISVMSTGGSRTSRAEGSVWFSRLLGRTGTDVTGVAAQLTDGTRVTASISNGWFLAWWPGTARASAAEVTSSNGTHTQPIDDGFGAVALSARRPR